MKLTELPNQPMLNFNEEDSRSSKYKTMIKRENIKKFNDIIKKSKDNSD